MEPESSTTSDDTLVFRRSDYDDGSPHMVPEDLRERISAVRLVRHVEGLVGRIPDRVVPNADARRLAAVLLWCLATGRYGSWDIQALCEEEPLCHHLAGSIQPTSADVHRFRREHTSALAEALRDLLALALPAGTPAVWDADAVRRLDRARQADAEASD